MKQKRNHKGKLLLLLCILAALCGNPAQAAENLPELGREGEIRLHLQYGGQPAEGGVFCLFQAGSLRVKDGGFEYALTEDFRDSGVSLKDIREKKLPGQLESYAKKKNLEGIVGTTDAKGSLTYDHLAPGLYLVVQEKAAARYEASKPFLVAVPVKNGNGWVYQVDASPKTAPRSVPDQTPTPKPPFSEKPGQKLPQTGQLKWPVPVLAVSGVLLFALGWTMYADRKSRDL